MKDGVIDASASASNRDLIVKAKSVKYLPLLLVLGGCTGVEQEAVVPVAQESKAIRLTVHADGSIEANGKLVSLEELPEMLDQLNPSSSVVFYHRENPQENGHPNAIAAFSLVTDRGLPIILCKNPECTDTVSGEEFDAIYQQNP